MDIQDIRELAVEDLKDYCLVNDRSLMDILREYVE